MTELLQQQLLSMGLDRSSADQVVAALLASSDLRQGLIDALLDIQSLPTPSPQIALDGRLERFLWETALRYFAGPLVVKQVLAIALKPVSFDGRALRLASRKGWEKVAIQHQKSLETALATVLGRSVQVLLGDQEPTDQPVFGDPLPLPEPPSEPEEPKGLPLVRQGDAVQRAAESLAHLFGGIVLKNTEIEDNAPEVV